MNLALPPAPENSPEASIRTDAWKDFCHMWNPDTQRIQYAHKILGMPLLEAYKFSQSSLSPETDTDVKAWYSALRTESKHLPDPHIFESLKEISSIEEFSQLDSAVQKASKIIIASNSFNKVVAAAWHLTTSDHPQPQAAIIVGLAMLLPDGPIPLYAKPQNPRDGESLVRWGLRVLEGDPVFSTKFAEWVTELRNKFPKQE